MELLSRIRETVFGSAEAQSAEGRRRTDEFRAKEVDEYDYVWFRPLEGEKNPLMFEIPIYHDEHSLRIRRALQNVKEGCVYEVTFVADNEKGTEFYCGEIRRMRQ